MAPINLTGTPVVGSMKSNTCDRREDDDVDEDIIEETSCCRLRRLWLVEKGRHDENRKDACMAIPRKRVDTMADLGLKRV
mmetsp:Transcript_13109/g.28484  ORF Transcript_13109/g.28484 Transcript_13109/m.28484 type:complete len:80 (-) Transcript_13109:112-351(-)